MLTNLDPPTPMNLLGAAVFPDALPAHGFTQPIPRGSAAAGLSPFYHLPFHLCSASCQDWLYAAPHPLLGAIL